MTFGFGFGLREFLLVTDGRIANRDNGQRTDDFWFTKSWTTDGQRWTREKLVVGQTAIDAQKVG